MGIFLLALAFLVGAVPGLLAAGDDRPAGPLVADRTVDRIAGPLLGSGTGPSTLDEPCTVAFFGGSDADCAFDPTASLSTQVGLGAGYDLNVSLVRPAADGTGREPLCLAGEEIRRCGSGSTAATVGPSIPDGGANVAVAHRSVFVDGRDATLVVRVW